MSENPWETLIFSNLRIYINLPRVKIEFATMHRKSEIKRSSDAVNATADKRVI